MKGIGTDEKRIIKEIITLTNGQRQIVKEKYKNMYGHTLEEDLKSELKGDFEDIVIALLTPRYKFEAQCMQNAMKVNRFLNASIHNFKFLHNLKGIGTNEAVIIELLCSKDASEIENLKAAYSEGIS